MTRRKYAVLVAVSPAYVRHVSRDSSRAAIGQNPSFDNTIEKPQSGRWRGANCCASSTVPLPLLTSPCLDLQVAALRPRKIWHAGALH